MLKLAGFQRTLARLYRLDIDADVDDYVRLLDPRDPEAERGEVVLVADEGDAAGVAVLLDPRVLRALVGEAANDGAIPRFRAWCMALEGVSHFTLLAWRIAHARPVSELELELQADVDKFVVGVVQRCLHQSPGDAWRRSRALRHALFETVAFRDAADTPRGLRYRLAHRLAAHYAASLEYRYIRQGRIGGMIDEVRDFYRTGLAGKWAIALAA